MRKLCLLAVLALFFSQSAAAISVREFAALQTRARDDAGARARYETYLRGVRDTLLVFNVEIGKKERRRFCLPENHRLTLPELERLILTELARNQRVIKKYPDLEVALVGLIALEEAYPCKAAK